MLLKKRALSIVFLRQFYAMYNLLKQLPGSRNQYVRYYLPRSCKSMPPRKRLYPGSGCILLWGLPLDRLVYVHFLNRY